MKASIGLSDLVKEKMTTEKRPDQKRVSFSQYSVYKSCPYRWYLTYGLGLHPFSSSINTVFGTAIHEAIQEHIRVMYSSSIKEAEKLDLHRIFYDSLRENYKKEVEANAGNHFSSKEELLEFYEDGLEILDTYKKKRVDFISPRHHNLIGIEVPIMCSIFDDSDKFLFYGFLDLVFQDKASEEITIDDFKTSTKGWSKYEKGDEVKQQQLVLYKHFFSKQYGIPEEKMNARFRIFKRKLWENADFPQSRVQTHIPASGPRKTNQALQEIKVFIQSCFEPDGTVKQGCYEKRPDKNNCRFCPFNDNPEMCNKSNLV